MLLYEMEYYRPALDYFQHSIRVYGAEANTLYNMGMCHYELGQVDLAVKCLSETLKLDSTFERATAMLFTIKAERKQNS